MSFPAGEGSIRRELLLRALDACCDIPPTSQVFEVFAARGDTLLLGSVLTCLERRGDPRQVLVQSATQHYAPDDLLPASRASWLVPIPLGVRGEPCGLLVGRSASSDIVLGSGSVSKVHARIQVDGERVHLTDLGSMNGTQVQGRRLTSHRQESVQEGDLLAFGAVYGRLVRARDALQRVVLRLA